jgi:hypothetical protein
VDQTLRMLMVTAIAIILCMALFVVAFKIIRAIGRVIVNVCRAATADAPGWLIAVAIIAAMLTATDVLVWFWQRLAMLIVVLVYELPSAIFVFSNTYLQECGESAISESQCLIGSLKPLNGLWAARLQPTWQYDFPFEQLVWGVAVFASVLLLGRLLRFGMPAGGPAWTWVNQPGRFWRGSAAPLALAFLIAVYLVITAIVAAPVFEQTPSDLQTTRDRLRESMAAFKPTLPAPNTQPSAEQNDAPAPALDIPVGAILRSDVSAMLTFVDDQLHLRTKQLSNDAEALSKVAGDFPQVALEYQERLVGHFERENRGRLGGRQTEEHADALAAQYRTWLSESASAARFCSAQIERAVLEIDTESRLLDSYRAAFTEDPMAIDATRASLLTRFSSFLRPLVQSSDATESMNAATAEASVGRCSLDLSAGLVFPPRNNIEDSLGIFGKATGWLLHTEYRALALITGLIGFGLFGALAASFIRASAHAENGVIALPPTTEIIHIFVRGIAAAILVYLVAMGGLTVFTKTEPIPNPYAVFFACFVAAVFSEDVWNWARQRQQAQFEKPDEETADDPPNDDAPPKNGGVGER